MPPVKRPRTTRAATYIAKTACPARRPPVPTEQNTNPAPPSSANAGMITLNFEALTASISTAVQQAVQSALSTASTSVDRAQIDASTAQVPETLVSQAVKSEISTVTSSTGQVTTYTKGSGPTTKFHSVAISLAARVSSKLKARIWAQEYTELCSLLTIAPSNNSYLLYLKTNNDNSSAMPKLCLEPNNKPRRIYNISQWLTVFNTFNKLQKCRDLLSEFFHKRSITLRHRQSLIGLLNFVLVIVLGCAFLHRLIDLTIGIKRPTHHTQLTKDAKDDLLVWLQFLDLYNGKSFFLDEIWKMSKSLELYTDSAGSRGYSAIFLAITG